MKKFLSVLLSLAIITATPNTGLCLSKEEKQSAKRASVSWKVVKETCKDIAHVIYDNAALISASVAAITLSSIPAFNGLKNRAEINRILSDLTLNNKKKAIKIVKILLLGKGTTELQNIEEKNNDPVNPTESEEPKEEQTNPTESGEPKEEQTNPTESGEPKEEQTNPTESPKPTSTPASTPKEKVFKKLFG